MVLLRTQFLMTSAARDSLLLAFAMSVMQMKSSAFLDEMVIGIFCTVIWAGVILDSPIIQNTSLAEPMKQIFSSENAMSGYEKNSRYFFRELEQVG